MNKKTFFLLVFLCFFIVSFFATQAEFLSVVKSLTYTLNLAPNQTGTITCVNGILTSQELTKTSYSLSCQPLVSPSPLSTSPPSSASPTPSPSGFTPPPSSTPRPSTSPATPGNGIWISHEELMQRPNSGAAWDAIQSRASSVAGGGNLSDQNSDHDVDTLAAALVCARTNQGCSEAISAIKNTIGSEEGSRWLAIGRNLTSYTIAADLMKNSGALEGQDLNEISSWLETFLTRTLRDNNSSAQEQLTPFESGSNASAQEAAVYISIAAFLDKQAELDYAWNRFRLYSCDKVNNPEQIINLTTSGWEHDSNNPCAINPAGTSKDGRRIDGAIINDIRRGGNFKWPPGYTSYPWVGIEGYIPAALMLHRQGYPSFEIQDRAVLRTFEFLWYLKEETGNNEWFDNSRSPAEKHLVNHIYGTNYPEKSPVGGGRTIGFTDWTHP